MLVAPAATPLTTPVDEPTVAMAVIALLHAPPPTASVSDIESPAHTADTPLIAMGDTLTVTVFIM